MTGRPLGAAAAALVVAGVVLLGAGAVLVLGAGATVGPFDRMMGAGGPYARDPGRGPGMMSGGAAGSGAAQPGETGFVAGTVSAPRIIDVIAGPGYRFTPSTITVERGETVTFRVTAMGPLVHEFMVGPADAVAADVDGTPEIADIGMMQTKSLTYTFDGSGPFAFACHADDHYENGMRGTIVLIG